MSPRVRAGVGRLGGTTLRTRLLIVLVLAYAPALGLTIFSHLEESRLEVQNVSHRATLAARLGAAAFERFFDGARQSLMAYAHMTEGGGRSSAEVRNSLRGLMGRYPYFSNIAVFEKDGTVLASAAPLIPSVSAENRAFFHGVLAANDFTVGEYEAGTGVTRPGVECGFPIRDAAGKVHRVLFAAMDLQSLATRAEELPLEPDAQVTLIDARGTVLAAYPSGHVRPGEIFPALAAVGASGIDGQPPRRDPQEHAGRLFASAPVRLEKETGLRVVYAIGVQSAYAGAQRRLRRDLVLLAAVGAMILLFGWSAGHFFITRHVKKLVDAAHRLSDGDLSSRTGVAHEPGELGRLATAVDQMAVSLQRRDEELRNVHQNLERQVADRTRELETTNHQLEAFSYSVSHDLRAPLRAIDGFSQILLNEHAQGLTPEGQRLLGVVVKNSKHMSQLIEDLLLFAKLGREEPRPTEVDMGAMARDVFEELAAGSRERRMKLDIRPLPPAMADAAMMLQVWSGLLSNAVKFTSKRPDALIEVGAEEGPTHNTFHVRDNGVGFDAQYAHRLFQVFQRLHSTAEFEGTGVGLAIVRRIVEKHGGKLWAETAANQGATFFFSLPRAEAA